MANVRASALLLILLAAGLAPLVTVPSVAGSVAWHQFMQDSNGDHIDDSLVRLGDGTADLFVRYDHYPTPAELAALRGEGLTPTYVSRAAQAVMLDDVPGWRLARLATLPGVAYIEPQPELHWTLDVAAPTLRARGSTTYSPDSAWELGYFGAGINVAIMDSGVNNVATGSGGYGHESLDDMDDDPLTPFDFKFISGVDCTVGACVPGDPELGDSAHGTHVAGIAVGTGGRGPDSDNRGIAPGARLIDIRVGAATNLNIVAVMSGFDWVIANTDTDWELDGEDNDGIQVLSMSFGGNGGNGQDSLSQAMNAVAEAGVVCVVAAGNSGSGGLGSPAVADHAITIANINDKNTVDRDDDSIAGSSSRGPRSSDGDGDHFDEMKPDVAAPGTGIMAPAAHSQVAYVPMDGTSMATPAVAGVIALMLEANPALQPTATIGYEWPIKRILHDTAQDYGTTTFPQWSTKFDGAYGWGQTDAYGAVRRAENLRSTDFAIESPVHSNEEATFTGSLDLFRSQWTRENDELVYVFDLPDDWGQPTNVRVASDHTTTLATDVQAVGDHYRLTATVTVRVPPSDTVNDRVEVLFESRAPYVSSTETHHGDFTATLNDLATTPSPGADVVVSPAMTPDLLVELREPLPALPREGESATLRVRVTNAGDSDATATLTLVNATAGFIDQSISIKAGDYEDYTAGWDTASAAGIHTFWANLTDVDPPDDDSNNRVSRQVRVNARPTAALATNVTEARATAPIRFTGENSTDDTGVAEYRFDFGDGAQSAWQAGDALDHAYDDGGNYSARVQVRDDDGWASEWSEPVELEINARPVAMLTANASAARPGVTVAFDGADSHDDGVVEEYRFDFGDDNATDWQAGDTAEHAYAVAGNYTAQLQVRDDTGWASEWDAWDIQVSERPVAVLTANDTAIPTGGGVTFDGTLSSGAAEYRFDFGDGVVTDWQAADTVEHGYDAAGSYDARLMVRDSDEWESVWSSATTIEVDDPPVAVLAANRTSVRVGDSIGFDGLDSSADARTYWFDFGDGNDTGWRDAPYVEHAYGVAGNYTARLRVDDDHAYVSPWDAVAIKVLPPLRRELALLLTPATGQLAGHPNETLELPVDIVNRGETTERVALLVAGWPWPVELPDPVELAPGEFVNWTLELRPEVADTYILLVGINWSGPVEYKMAEIAVNMVAWSVSSQPVALSGIAGETVSLALTLEHDGTAKQRPLFALEGTGWALPSPTVVVVPAGGETLTIELTLPAWPGIYPLMVKLDGMPRLVLAATAQPREYETASPSSHEVVVPAGGYAAFQLALTAAAEVSLGADTPLDYLLLDTSAYDAYHERRPYTPLAQANGTLATLEVPAGSWWVVADNAPGSGGGTEPIEDTTLRLQARPAGGAADPRADDDSPAPSTFAAALLVVAVAVATRRRKG